MSTDGSGDPHQTPEERAEQLMERLVSEGSRTFARLLGRAREEAEDILAEAHSLNERWRSSPRD